MCSFLLWQIPREARFLGSRFQNFQPMVTYLYCFWVVLRQNIMTQEECGTAKLLISWWLGSREKKGLGTRHSFQSTSSDLCPPGRPYLPIMPSNHKCISGLIYWLVQSSWDPVICQGMDQWAGIQALHRKGFGGDHSYPNYSKLPGFNFLICLVPTLWSWVSPCLKQMIYKTQIRRPISANHRGELMCVALEQCPADDRHC